MPPEARKILESLGLSTKATDVYLACLKLGPAPVRKIAIVAGINRGTTYDLLKILVEVGLVSYFHKEKHQYFVGENPEKLNDLVEARVRELETTRRQLETTIPELKSIHDNASGKPVARYYEGFKGIKRILEDVIATTALADPKAYVAYSSAGIRPYLYKGYPKFTDDRIAAEINVRVIAIGAGGETRGLDERKWLPTKEPSPTYQLIYPGKLALITVDAGDIPLGVTIEDKNLSDTQRLIFDELWQRL